MTMKHILSSLESIFILLAQTDNKTSISYVGGFCNFSFISDVMLYNLHATDTHKQFRHQQTALIFEYNALLHVSTTACSHHQGVSALKGTSGTLYSIYIS